jgi:hypothetical protein
MTLFWHPTGPLLKFDGEVLYVENLNPETKTLWRMSRKEMLATGWRFMWAAIWKVPV